LPLLHRSLSSILKRYAAASGSIDAVRGSGFAAEQFARAYADSIGLHIFSVQRNNGTGFDLITAKVNNGVVSDVMIMDIKNTIGEIPSATAMGAGAKKPAENFNGNIKRAIDVLENSEAYRGSDITSQVSKAISNGNYGMALVTTPHARVGANVASQVQAASGKTLMPPLRWLP
jgi:hypothetical protein